MQIRCVTTAQVRSMRGAMPAAHVADEDDGAVHLGAFVGDTLVGVVSGLPVGPEGRPEPGVLQVYGPFGAHGEALVEVLADRLPDGRLWSSVPCPGLTEREGRWERRMGYSAADIVVLEGLEVVRKRPGMYVGGVGANGLAHLLWELVSNSIDEHLAGHARHLRVGLGPLGISVADDGRGIPVDADPTLLEMLCTRLHGGSTFGDQRRVHVHVGHHGLGIPVVSALSSAMVVTVDRGHRYQQVFVRGCAVGPLIDAGPAVGRGTAVTFVPDAGIFGAAEIDRERVRSVLADHAVLNPGLRIDLDGETLPSHGGLAGYARALAEGPITREWSTRGTSDGITVDIAVCWGSGPSSTMRGWANQLPGVGSHVDGLAAGLRGTPTDGRVALIAVQLAFASYEGRTRERLSVEAVRALVEAVVRREM